MAEYIIFPLGDWSCDGHNCYADFLVKTEKTLQEVREAHLKENHFIGSLCQEYEDNKIEIQPLYEFLLEYVNKDEAKNILQKFVDSGVDLTDEEQEFNSLMLKSGLGGKPGEKIQLNFEEDEDNPQSFIIHSPEVMLDFWIMILNVIDPTLKLEVVSEAMSSYYIKYKGYPYEPSGDINFYGYDEQKRHLDTPGYGVWKDYEGEFYHPQ